MRSRTLFLVGAVTLIGVAMVAGLLTIGGPFEARRQKLDRSRYADLTIIARALSCRGWRDTRPILPAKLTLDNLRSHCDKPKVGQAALLDNETGIPYRYVRENDREFSICAKFYDAEKLFRLKYADFGDLYALDPMTGCVNGRVR